MTLAMSQIKRMLDVDGLPDLFGMRIGKVPLGSRSDFLSSQPPPELHRRAVKGGYTFAVTLRLEPSTAYHATLTCAAMPNL